MSSATGRSMVRRVLAAAGRAVGRSQAAERGTVLLMVIGVLAMMSIVALVYASIGQADRRSAASLARETRLDDQAQNIADYISRIIAADLFSYHTDPASGKLFRELTDYPSSNPLAKSVEPDLLDGEVLFDPVGFDGFDPWLAATEPTSVFIPGLTLRDPNYLNAQDWAHISNLSPNGRFVNLVALRNNFRAPPGNVSGGMSEWLTLFGNDGRAQLHNAQQLRPDGIAADRDFPYDWTANQVKMNRPAADLDQRAAAPGPGAPEYPLNQYADADGDGMLDSRWFELIGRDPTNGTNLFPIVQTAGPARLFVAARVIDLSGLVNVNTASEFQLRPDRTNPVGRWPSEIDLRRLLRMQDFYDLHGEAYDGYELFHPTQDPYSDYDAEMASRVGSAAYTALRLAREGGPVPRPDRNDGYGAVPAAGPLTAIFRGDNYRRYGFDPAGGSNAGPPPQFQRWSGRPFGIADELELRAFHGANDPSTLSRLEAAVAGRRLAADPIEPLCPLRSNRDLELERGGRGDFFPTNQQTPPHTQQDGLADDHALLQIKTDIRSLLTTHNGARFLRPVELTNSTIDIIGDGDLRLDLAKVLADISGGVTATADEQRRQLFATYALALMPNTTGDDRTPAWDEGDPDHRNSFPLAYGGRGPQMALLFAAHMTANLIDMYDNAVAPAVDDPTALVVNLRSPNTPIVPTGHRLMNLDEIRPAWLPSSESIPPPRLDPDAAAATEASEARIYGIEAQPFLTEVSSFLLFTDAIVDAGGDQDWEEIPGSPPTFEGKITINGDIAATNSDFIMQVVAYQVHNPFDVDVDLSDYYFQFGNDIHELQSTGADAILPARGTRIVFATNPGRAVVDTRWSRISPAGTVNEWLATQLNLQTQAEIDSAEMRRSYARNGDPIAPATVEDMLDLSGSASNRVALLWRKFGDDTSRDDDILADRLRDPQDLAQSPTWDRRFDLEDDIVAGTTSGEEGTLDNTGFTIMLFGTVRRPADPNAGGDGSSIPRGAIPAFCIERKNGVGNSLNHRETDGVEDLDGLERDDFARPTSYTTFQSFVADQLNNKIEDIGLAVPPRTKTMGPRLAATEHPLNIDYQYIYPEIHLNGTRFLAGTAPDTYRTLRLGDVLLPLAVGPQRLMIGTAPPPNTPIDIPLLEAQWTTLAEALAIGTGYGNHAGPADPMHRLGVDVLDRGHLKLDASVPFFKESPPAEANQFAQPWIFDETGANPDTRRFPAIPLAQHLLDQFRPEKYGNARRLVPGVININTAPLSVLKLLPLLTPERDYTGNNVGWLTDNDIASQLVGGTTRWFNPGAGDTWDIAAMIKAYRDKTLVLTRGSAFADPATGRELDFLDDNAPADPPNGRSRRTLIQGQRETAGFTGVGEILSVMQRGLDATTGLPTFDHPDADLGNSLVRFGYADEYPPANSETTANIVGIDSTTYTDSAGTGNFPDDIVNDYDEQLTIASAVLNSITTRSDVFCVWFVVHGYLPSDVEGLGANDPMIPSIARRYVMVVDRSNVTRRGEKPRILLFQEVPL